MLPVLELAKLWASDERTISRWKKAGAPLDGSTEAMKAWLMGRKRVPAGTAALLEGKPPPARSVPPPQAKAKAKHPRPVRANDGQPYDETARGAAAALRRLETEELAASEDYKRLIADPDADPDDVDNARTAWLKLVEALRKADLAVDAARRDAGTLLPRDELEGYAQGFLINLVGSYTGSLEALCPRIAGLSTPQECWRVIKPTLDRALSEALEHAAARAWNGKPAPKWLTETLQAARCSNL